MLNKIVKKILQQKGYEVIRQTDLGELWEKGQLTARSLRLKFFRQLAKKGFIPTHIVDVGANKGEWSRAAHEVFPGCVFTLIEPQVEMKPYLDQFCSEAKGSWWILAGAGASDGELPILVRTDEMTASSFATTEEEAREKGWPVERRVVPIVTLDSICEGTPAPEVVKIDAEGFELEVMKGARGLVGEPELFFLEVPLLEFLAPGQKTIREQLEYMDDNGYEMYDFTEYVRRPSDGALAMMEIAYARRSGVLRDPSRPVW